MKEGMIWRYHKSRGQQCYKLERRLAYSLNNPLLAWVQAFGPFMKGKTK